METKTKIKITIPLHCSLFYAIQSYQINRFIGVFELKKNRHQFEIATSTTVVNYKKKSKDTSNESDNTILNLIVVNSHFNWWRTFANCVLLLILYNVQLINNIPNLFNSMFTVFHSSSPCSIPFYLGLILFPSLFVLYVPFDHFCR